MSGASYALTTTSGTCRQRASCAASLRAALAAAELSIPTTNGHFHRVLSSVSLRSRSFTRANLGEPRRPPPEVCPRRRSRSAPRPLATSSGWRPLDGTSCARWAGSAWSWPRPCTGLTTGAGSTATGCGSWSPWSAASCSSGTRRSAPAATGPPRFLRWSRPSRLPRLGRLEPAWPGPGGSTECGVPTLTPRGGAGQHGGGQRRRQGPGGPSPSTLRGPLFGSGDHAAGLFRAPHLATDTAAFWFVIRYAGSRRRQQGRTGRARPHRTRQRSSSSTPTARAPPSTPPSGTPRLWRTTRPANRSGDVDGLPAGRTWPPWW
jgi:hypothetical protein